MTKVFESFKQKVADFVGKRALRSLEHENDYLRESLDRITLDLELKGYMALSESRDMTVNHFELRKIVKLCHQMAIKNPITCRSVNVQADYVFGQGVTFIAKEPEVQVVVDEFLNYFHNRRALTGHTAMLVAEKKFQISGNLFFALFTNGQTGRVEVRIIDFLDVKRVLCDPNDYCRELYIAVGTVDRAGVESILYYPAFGNYEEAKPPLPWVIDPDMKKGTILWDTPVYHVSSTRYFRDHFGIPDLWPQLDWALSYKKTLENWISIIAAYARMAMRVGGLKKKQAAAAKSMLQSSVTSAHTNENNPSPAAAAFALSGRNVEIEPIKTAGATTGADEASPVLNMAGCAVGLPNTFYGDAGKGNFATAKTLDRPTELKMISRQKFWEEIFIDIIGYVVMQAGSAPEGLLTGKITVELVTDVFSGEPTWAMKPATDGFNPMVLVHFPDILERNVTDRVRALVNAVTQFGKPLSDIIPDKKLVCLWLMQALGVENPEQYLPTFMEMWQKNMSVGDDGKPVDPGIIPPLPPDTGKGGAEDPSQGGDVGANG